MRLKRTFDRTYEGLKHDLIIPEILADATFDRTYEGLKLGGESDPTATAVLF